MKTQPLTKEQQETFKKLYLQGYSASLIFENLGVPYDPDGSFMYNQRMRYWRVKLGLPLRGIGHVPKFTRHRTVSDPDKKQRRIRTLTNSINHWQSKIKVWKKELSKLQKE